MLIITYGSILTQKLTSTAFLIRLGGLGREYYHRVGKKFSAVIVTS